MSLDTTAMAYPIPPDALLAAEVGDTLAAGHPIEHDDGGYCRVRETWAALADRIDALPTFKLCGTDVPGGIGFELGEASLGWDTLHADILGPPLAGEGPDWELPRTSTGTRRCVGPGVPWTGIPDAPQTPRLCQQAALDGSAYCDQHQSSFTVDPNREEEPADLTETEHLQGLEFKAELERVEGDICRSFGFSPPTEPPRGVAIDPDEPVEYDGYIDYITGRSEETL